MEDEELHTATVGSMIDLLKKFEEKLGPDCPIMFTSELAKTLYAPIGSGVLGNGTDSFAIIMFQSTDYTIPERAERVTADTPEEVLKNAEARAEEVREQNGQETN